MFNQRMIGCMVSFWLAWLAIDACDPQSGSTRQLFAQASEQPSEAAPANGWNTVSGKHLEVVTDLPLTPELEALPEVFEAAMPVWCAMFGAELEEVQDWRATAYIMLDRGRFQSAGLIPDSLPEFPYGFQYEDRLWVIEQPSPYYRRHLLLHEGTHWFMNRKYGSAGPPWLMEGMAEWLATHRWSQGELSMAIIPATKDEVPYWGRISLIQDQLAEGIAPSLETILRYDSRAHRQVEAYAWSWAVVLFFAHHPDTREAFIELLEQPMRGDLSQTRWLFKRLRSRWPKLRQDWSGFLYDLEYGYSPEHGMFRMAEDPRWIGDQPRTMTLRADRTWQSSGWVGREGQAITVSADGMISVGSKPGAWRSTADGVTLEYYRGQPLGKLLMAVAAPNTEPSNFTPVLEVVSIGQVRTCRFERTGELFFRVNESNAGLGDNEGTFEVVITP